MDKDLRTAAIVELVKETRQRLGKVQVQKLIYFAQQSGVPLEYKYEMYHYGPYSFELARQLDSLDSLGVLTVQSDPSGFGFDISAGKFADKFVLSPKFKKKITDIISQFGLSSPAQLEVKATVHFVHSVMKNKGTKADVINKVRALKPRFTDKFVKDCYGELERAQWL